MTDLQEQIDSGAIDAAELALKLEHVQLAADRLLSTGLKRRTLCLLLADASGVGMRDIDAVLRGLEFFADRFLSDPEPEEVDRETE